MTDGDDFDIIFLALPRWDALYSSTALSLAKALSKNRRVFYIENPFTTYEYLRKFNSPEVKSRESEFFSKQVAITVRDTGHPSLYFITPRLTLPINWLPPGVMYNLLSSVNDYILSSTVNALLKQKSICRFIFINSFNPLYGSRLKLDCQPLLKIYHCVDDIAQAPYLLRHGPRLQHQMILASDFTIVTSTGLKKKLSEGASNIFLLPNAADTLLFNTAVRETLAMPKEFIDLPRGCKIIVYIGNLCQRLDYPLIKKIALAHSEKYVILIGPHARTENGNFHYEESEIRSCPNVLMIGPKKLAELPVYLQHAHCAIIPFLCNDLTKSIYPLKVNEYLAAGIPVVSTAFSDDIVTFREVVKVAQNHQQFIDAIDKVIEIDSPQGKIQRMLFAASNSWEARAHCFIELVVEFLKHHDRRTGLSQRRKRKQTVNR